MKLKYLLSSIILLLSISGSSQIFDLYEQELYDKNKDTQPIQNGQYADINSTLLIKLHKELIAESIQTFSGGDTINLKEIKQLRLVLANQVKIMQDFLTYANDPNLDNLNNLATPMNEFFEEADKFPEIQQLYNTYSAEYTNKYSRAERRKAGTEGIPFREEYIFTQMAKKADALAQSIQSSINTDKVNFLLSGRMTTSTGTRNIKLSDDFDTFTADTYTVSRWQTQLTEEGKQELQKISDLSTTLNNLMVAKSSDIKNWILSGFQADDCLKDIEAKLKILPAALDTVAPEVANELKTIILSPYAQAKLLVGKYTTSITKASDIIDPNLLQGFSSDLNSTADSIESLINTMDSRLIGVLKALPQNPIVADFIATYDTCKVELMSDRDKILNAVHRVSALLSNSKNAAESAGDLSDKVKRLSFDDIPESSQIDLRSTGQRANGDEINISAILEMPATSGGDLKRKVIERRSFKVQQIGLYSRVRPLLLLANPIGDGPNIDLSGRRFQFAPSYSILFKFGSRTSKAINEIWQPSIGVNFGALDFNTDATPEFSTALEFTFLNDYFSVGYGYNFGVDTDYFMLGFRIPVGALPLPMFNNVESTNNF